MHAYADDVMRVTYVQVDVISEFTFGRSFGLVADTGPEEPELLRDLSMFTKQFHVCAFAHPPNG
jgi:hypothetical protein